MMELIKNIVNEESRNFIVILDKASFHLTISMFELYNNNRLKILFGVP